MRAADCRQSWRGCAWWVRICILNLLLILCCILFLTLLLIFCSSGECTALHMAALNGQPAVCEVLIAGKADVDAKDRCAFIFWICCWFCVVFCFLTLPLIFCSSGQHTALHYAAINGHTAVCELLIAGKADVDAKNRCAFIFWICCWFCVVFCF